MLDEAIPQRPVRGSMPGGVQLLIMLGLPFLGAATVVGIWVGKEIIVAAAWAGMLTAAMILFEPLIGVVALTGGLLLVAYPSILQNVGFLTLGNLFGVCLAVQLVITVLGTRDLSFLRVPQVVLLVVIGLIFIASIVHADTVFPLLQVTVRPLSGPRAVLDKTELMMNNFWTRLALLIFICAFVHRKRDIRILFATFVGILYLAVPSALFNWAQGELFRGFRAAASLTVGANANRLAMICLVQILCAWYWGLAGPGRRRRVIAGAVILSSLLVFFASGSRSGLLGAGLLLCLLQTGPRTYRVPTPHIGAVLVLAVLTVSLIAPPEAWERMVRFSTDDPHAPGYTSTVKREQTVNVGWRMFRDHGLTGVGMGNFQEVARQVYDDQYYKPTHNSYLWAAVEGGVLCLGTYLLLLWVTWRDIGVIMRLAPRAPDLAYMAPCLRAVFLLHCFFSAFADLWLNPITYVMFGIVVTLRRHLESVPAVQHVDPATARLALAVAR